MPSYHFSAQIIGRKAGHSSVAAAAYRAGARLRDERSGREHDFLRKRGVAHSEIVLPEGAAPWLADRQVLWNHVEALEKRKDAQLAREINMALPHELTAAQRLELVRGFVREQFVRHGMVADIALHEPVPEKGDDPRNFHAHVLLTLRQARGDGLGAVKTRAWNSDTLLKAWREAWSLHQNRALERAGGRERVDHRRLREQRQDAERRGDRPAALALDRAPEVHMGRRARRILRNDARPESRERQDSTARPSGGVFRSARQAERRFRPVEYPVFDQGSRPVWNASIVAGNVKRTYDLVDKLERQAVRVRERHLRSLRLANVPAMRLALGMDYRQAIARKHVQRSEALGRVIEELLAGLFHIRKRRMDRHRSLLRVREHHLFAGRRRD
ncbi:MobQ family relaxase [Agrobacterium sp. ES01]|uniref:MobQ family relaxase n=1 Tax=Agrobacterium sp. ES01 TaxID=3420714 RepID=UPI003D0C2031